MLVHALASAEYAYSLLAFDNDSFIFVDTVRALGFAPIYAAALVGRYEHDQTDHPRVPPWPACRNGSSATSCRGCSSACR
jgi:hypothetical protein